MERTPRTLLITTIGIIFFIFIIVFGYNRFGRYINGPEIVSISLENYQSIDTFSINIEGTVKNTQNISVNNRPITINQDNSFTETIVVSPGLTIIEIDMSDSFGKEKQYTYQIYSTKEEVEYQPSYSKAQQEQHLLENEEIIN